MMRCTVRPSSCICCNSGFVAAEKPNGNAGKGYHCRKLAYEKYHIQDGRALNKAIGPAIQRCKQLGPSASRRTRLMSAFGGKADMPFALKCLLLTQSGHSMTLRPTPS